MKAGRFIFISLIALLILLSAQPGVSYASQGAQAWDAPALPTLFPVPPDSLGALEDVEEVRSFTLLLIGVDSYFDKISGRSDSMILCRLDRNEGKIKIVSFMRDLYVRIPGRGNNRLNAAFVFGGQKLLRETLFNQFGVTADAYIAVNFTLMKEMVDQLGGVDITITKAEMTQINYWSRVYYARSRLNSASYVPLNEYGLVHLRGDQALAFSRIRNIDSDYQRTRRQRDVIAALFTKAAAMSNGELVNLVINNIGRVQTDIALGQALELLPLLTGMRRWEIETLRIPADKCFSSRTISGMAVLVPDLKKNQNVLKSFLGDAP